MKKETKNIFIHIILPIAITIALFIASFFIIIIPSFENSMIDKKKEMITELVRAAVSEVEKYETDSHYGRLSETEAKNRAISALRSMRYGSDLKDYYWITDMQPIMIMHPYRTDLEGKDLTDFTDPHGKYLFVETVKVVKKSGEGYVKYMWQWKDDESRIVPKLSYVKHFKQWNWIIGTGIYLDDVAKEIHHLTNRLILISLSVLLIITILMIYLTRESLGIEYKRKAAEIQLSESREQYRLLLETATEGIIMILDNKIIFVNRTTLNLLKYAEEDILAMLPNEIFPDIKKISKNYISFPFKTKVKQKTGDFIDVLIQFSTLSFAGKESIIVSIKEDTAEIYPLELNKEFQTHDLINNLSVGIFRTLNKKNGHFIEINSAALTIFDIPNHTDAYKTCIEDLIHNPEDIQTYQSSLSSSGFIDKMKFLLKKKDSSMSTISVSAKITYDNEGKPLFIDGSIEDITQEIKKDINTNQLITELQTTNTIYSLKVGSIMKKIISCSIYTTIEKAIQIMSKYKTSYLIVTADNDDYIGIITNNDIRDRIINNKMDLNQPILTVMSSPLFSINEHSVFYEAINLMNKKEIHHVCVKNNNNNIIGIVTNNDIVSLLNISAVSLSDEIKKVQIPDDLHTSHQKLIQFVRSMFIAGSNVKSISSIMTKISDAISNRVIDLFVEEIGSIPIPFAFIKLGSEGREEQTLSTDQDNALLYADTKNNQKNIETYFKLLSEKINTSLNTIGYDDCKGKVMAKNPKWCQPLSIWKKYFSEWIESSVPQDILDINIFFDIRFTYGDINLVNDLKNHIFKVAKERSIFFWNLAQHALYFRPSLNIFRNVSASSSKDNPETINIKLVMTPIVVFARLYALKNECTSTNTEKRLNELMNKGIISKNFHDEIIQVYNFLMTLRLKHQFNCLDNNAIADNLIYPKQLTAFEKEMLKKAFSLINNYQTKINNDFKVTL